MKRIRLIAALLAGATAGLTAQNLPAIFPLRDIRAGQHGIGKTVFSGTKVEDFQVEILGVLENLGPKESIILAKLTGGPLTETGVMQGMSGSPVYIDGRLVGAVALSFPQAKEAIAGIRPIEDMLKVRPQAQRQVAGLPRASERPALAGGRRLEEIATPVSFVGFSGAALDQFSPQLRKLGLDPRQGISGGGNPTGGLGDPSQLQPGSMISVQLLAGDMSVGADGTVTAIDGQQIYAFGHRFLASGTTSLPFARSEVLALLPNVTSSFKISTAREWMGAITGDLDTAVSGVLGRTADTIPFEIRVGAETYRMRMIQDRVMSPLLVQMALFSAIDSTQRALGAQSYRIRGQIGFAGGPVQIDDVYSGDIAVSALAAGGIASTVSFGLQSGFDALKLSGIQLSVDPLERRTQLQITDIIAPRIARPGEEIEARVVMTGENGMTLSRSLRYRVPVGAPLGPLFLTAADATQTNLLEFQRAVGTPQQSGQQVLALLNGLRSNTNAYLRVWRNEPAYSVNGLDLPGPPPSLSLILNRRQSGLTTASATGAKWAELEVSPGAGYVVTGAKTLQIEVQE